MKRNIIKLMFISVITVLSFDLSAQIHVEELSRREVVLTANSLSESAESWGIEPSQSSFPIGNTDCPEVHHYVRNYEKCIFTLATYVQKYDFGGVSHGQPYCEAKTIVWEFPPEACH